MRAHQLLDWIAPSGTSLSLDSYELHTVFGLHKLLPKSLYADVDVQDAEAWAFFCFCLWTSSDVKRPSGVARDLAGDGVNVWTDVSNESSNFVQWLHATITNWEKATSVVDLAFDLTSKQINVYTTSGEVITFRDKYAAGNYNDSVSIVRHIKNTATNAGGGVVLWHLAGHFCGLVVRGHDDEPAPRGDVNPLRVTGNKYRK